MMPTLLTSSEKDPWLALLEAAGRAQACCREDVLAGQSLASFLAGVTLILEAAVAGSAVELLLLCGQNAHSDFPSAGAMSVSSGPDKLPSAGPKSKVQRPPLASLVLHFQA